jgi:8-oxo-dGTP diphosphatase
MGETFFECAEREVMEETGLKIKNMEFLTVTNNIFSKEKHDITIFVKCDQYDENMEPEILEKEKCDIWKYFTWKEAKSLSPLFLPFENFINLNIEI